MSTSSDSHGLIQWHGTTIIGVKVGGKTVIAGDGQVSMGNTVMKPNAKQGGRLGDGAEEERATIVTVEGLRDAVAVVAGDDHTCALRGGGGVVCWGSNDEGALGDGSTSTRLVPVPVTGIPRARGLVAGEQVSCALAATSEVVHCWGRDLTALDVPRVWDVARRPMAVRGLP